MNNTTNSTTGTPNSYPMEGVLDAKITLAVHVVTLLVGTIANVFVFAALLTKKTRKTDQDVMVLNLCFADWMIIMVKFPLKLDVNFRYIYWSEFVCRFVELLPTVCHIAGIYTIVLMAVNRCRVLINPILASQMRLTVAVMWCIVIWMMSFAFLIPLALLRYSYNFKYCWIIPLTEYQDYLFKVYRCVSIAFMFPVPLHVIAISYIRLGIHLYSQRVPRVAYVQGTMQMDAGRKQNLAIIKTLAVIVLLFAAFMLPLFVARVQYEVLPPEEITSVKFYNFTAYTRLVALVHSCVNPIIYGSLTKYFRQKFKIWLCCCRRREPAQNVGEARSDVKMSTKQTSTQIRGSVHQGAVNDGIANESFVNEERPKAGIHTGSPINCNANNDMMAMTNICTLHRGPNQL